MSWNRSATNDLRFPISRWCPELPREHGHVDRDGADNPNDAPNEHGEQSNAPEPEAGGHTLENRYSDP